ncbi:ATP-dependent helicase [Marinomonas epiphytica]
MIPKQPEINGEQGFTAEQRAVISHDLTHPAKVIAVAGAGKTTTLIGRIKYLLEQGVEASKIGVFMFNKSAQEEFSSRLGSSLSQLGYARSPDVMTFHAFGMKLCRRLEQQNWLSSAKLLTDDFSLIKMLREAVQRLMRKGVAMPVQDEKDWLEDALLFIDQVKASDSDPQTVFKQLAWSKERNFFPALFDELETLRERQNVRFFADLLSDPFALLKTLSAEQKVQIDQYLPQFDYLLIDEFQDINPCQYELLKLLYPAPCQWMIVGDVQQCIYEWRGASPDIMANQFDQDFSPVITYPLSRSFRFGHAIGLMASSVISENDHNALVLGVGDSTRVAFARDKKVGKALLGELKSWLEEGKQLQDCAVLARLYSDMVPVQLALMHKNLPYQLHGDSPLLENRQIRMLMAYMAVMAGGLEGTANKQPIPLHTEDLEYLLSVPSLGGAASQRKVLVQQAKQAPHLLPQIIENLADNAEGWRGKKLLERADWLRSLTLYRNDPGQGLQHTIEKLRIYRYFESTSSKDIQAQEKIATCEAFIAYVRGVGQDAQTTLKKLFELNEQHEDNPHGVHLMTIHKSKGLEFDQVVVTGLREGRFPYYEEDLSHIDRQAAKEMSSERRLFYVAITRAKQKLVVLEAPTKDEHKRLVRGEIPTKSPQSQSLSRFIYESQPYGVSQICKAWVSGASDEPIDTAKGPVFQRYLQSVEGSPNLVFRHKVETAQKLLKAGDKVRHEKFGEGVVVRPEQGEDSKVLVDFAEQGLKKFNPKYTQLIKLSSR